MDQDLEREGGWGGKQTHERGVNHVEQRATVCFLSPSLELCTFGGGGQKTANNAAIQRVISLLLIRNNVI